MAVLRLSAAYFFYKITMNITEITDLTFYLSFDEPIVDVKKAERSINKMLEKLHCEASIKKISDTEIQIFVSVEDSYKFSYHRVLCVLNKEKHYG